MNYQELKLAIENGKIDESLKTIKCVDDVTFEKGRYLNVLETAFKEYGDGDYHFVSSPGRTEIGGNHTDHQHGRVVAASLDMDDLAAFKASDDNKCTFYDPKFRKIEIDISDLSKREDELNSGEGIIRGICNRLVELGYKVGGFKAYCDSEVLNGSGISSSACFEVLVVEILNALYNNEKISPVERALISQYAENVYYGKPCGLLDQLAISVGGFVTVDFKDPSNPVIENFDFNFSDYGYELVLVNTKGDHADLSDEYAAVTREIKAVANFMGHDVLRDCDPKYFFEHMKDIREATKNDRGVLRSYHFFKEDERAELQKQAIKNKDIDSLLKLMNESGRSSFMYLQNVYPASIPNGQPISIGLALTADVLKDKGAYRVHGGGFGGTIQAIVPKDMLNEYKEAVSKVFGEDAYLSLKVRPFGTKTII